MLLSAIHSEEGEERLNLLMVDNRIPAGAKLYWYLVDKKTCDYKIKNNTLKQTTTVTKKVVIG